MPYELQLLKALKNAGWKVKIREKERLEDPHVTIFKKSQKWRLGLRDKQFLDPGHNWNQIHKLVREAIEDENNWEQLINEWNSMYPHNPVNGGDDE